MTEELFRRAEIEAALERLLRSDELHRQAGLQRFLQFVVTETLDGRAGSIKEYTIGVSVYGRGSRFDPRVDAIVRVEAKKLRERLDEYYGGSGSRDPVRILLNKGGYVPQFRRSAAPGLDCLGTGEAEEAASRGWFLLHHQTTQANVEEAIACFWRAVMLSSKKADYYASLAQAYFMSVAGEGQRPEAAIPMVRMTASEALRLQEDRSHAQVAGFVRSMACGEGLGVAVGHLKKAIRLDPRNAEARLWASFACAAMNDFEGALAQAQAAVDLQPLSPAHLSMKGALLHLAGNREQALAQLRFSIDLKPDHYLSSYWLSRVHSILDQHEKAVEYAQRAFELSPCAFSLSNRGYVQARAGLREAAESTLTEYLSPMSSHVATHAGRAAILGALGRVEEARAALHKGLAANELSLFFARQDPVWSYLF